MTATAEDARVIAVEAAQEPANVQLAKAAANASPRPLLSAAALEEVVVVEALAPALAQAAAVLALDQIALAAAPVAVRERLRSHPSSHAESAALSWRR